MTTLNKYTPAARAHGPYTITVDTAQIWYDPKVFMAAESAITESTTPTKAIATWKIYVIDSAGDTHVLYEKSGLEMGRYQNKQQHSLSVSNLPLGQATVYSEIVSVTYSPAVVNDWTFLTPGSTAQTTVTVKDNW